MQVPDELRYSEDHQWVRQEGDLWRVGITAFAQDALGEVTVVNLAAPDQSVGAGEELGEIEAFKAMTDVYMPALATVVEHNESLHETPTAINNDPYGDGWLCLVRPDTASDFESLLDAAGYRDLIGLTDA